MAMAGQAYPALTGFGICVLMSLDLHCCSDGHTTMLIQATRQLEQFAPIPRGSNQYQRVHIGWLYSTFYALALINSPWLDFFERIFEIIYENDNFTLHLASSLEIVFDTLENPVSW